MKISKSFLKGFQDLLNDLGSVNAPIRTDSKISEIHLFTNPFEACKGFFGHDICVYSMMKNTHPQTLPVTQIDGIIICSTKIEFQAEAELTIPQFKPIVGKFYSTYELNKYFGRYASSVEFPRRTFPTTETYARMLDREAYFRIFRRKISGIWRIPAVCEDGMCRWVTLPVARSSAFQIHHLAGVSYSSACILVSSSFHEVITAYEEEVADYFD